MTNKVKIQNHNSDVLSDEQYLDIYRKMVLSRVLDQRVWQLNRQGKAAIVASAQGHEAGQIASVFALRAGHDNFYIYYRDLSVLIGLGLTPREIMSGFLAKNGEPLSNARQFPTHGAHVDLNIVNLSNVVGTQIPQAVGASLASKLRGEDVVTIVYFGDGAASVGDCHEGMNFAAIHKLPIIFFCENNNYAISVPISKQMAIENISTRAESYGMPGVLVDGIDVSAVYEVTVEAAKKARLGEGPTLIEAKVERYLPHTSDDDDTRYRSVEEIEQSKKRDPVKLLRSRLISHNILDEEKDEIFVQEAKQIVNEATRYAEAQSFPDVSTFYENVYSDTLGELSSR